MPSFCVSSAINRCAGRISGLPAAVAACNAERQRRLGLRGRVERVHVHHLHFVLGKMFRRVVQRVKVESVPLNSDQFSGNRPDGAPVHVLSASARLCPCASTRRRTGHPRPRAGLPPPGLGARPFLATPAARLAAVGRPTHRPAAGRASSSARIAAALVVVVGAVVAVVRSSPKGPLRKSRPARPSPQSDEEQIEDVVEKFEEPGTTRTSTRFEAHRVRGHAQRTRVQRDATSSTAREGSDDLDLRSPTSTSTGTTPRPPSATEARTPTTSTSPARTASGSGASSDRQRVVPELQPRDRREERQRDPVDRDHDGRAERSVIRDAAPSTGSSQSPQRRARERHQQPLQRGDARRPG